MRKYFKQDLPLDGLAIGEVKFDMKSRHQLPPLLAALQYIFETPEINEQVFAILEQQILKDKKATGRPGMSLWEVLVLGCVRLLLNTDYDSLHDLSNNHESLRGILGVHTTGSVTEKHCYNLSTIKENVRLLDEETVQKINTIIVKAGHQLKKKEKRGDDLKLEIKADTYPVESNVHFPTDMNLLWDSMRKSLDMIMLGIYFTDIKGWRKINYLRKDLKKYYRITSEIHRKKGGNYKERLVNAAGNYLEKSKKLSKRIGKSMEEIEQLAACNPKVIGILEELKYYEKMLNKHIDLLERRIIKGEKIPHKEKVFSIFEEHAEWLNKGKANGAIVIGHNVLIATDQYGFIVDHHVAIQEVDSALAIPLGARLSSSFAEGYVLESISFDRGFHSKLAKENLNKIFEKVIMPKPGKKNKEEELEEAEADYVVKRKRHSAVESNINELEHCGVDRVPDKGLEGFKSYTALGVMAYNLKRLGKLLIAQKIAPRKSQKVKRKTAIRQAA